ncbi:biotin synthase [Bacillus sp. FJAT-22090]|uniref:biotin synthase BioB n=1 Tax=Bacillus sp. FJAT-22090 TaxID=1581038 RepID=UPI0006AE36F2|nr:biotin synthase BioB [Bacillus sp. FJAT-22090]ALC87711.1 biotin synthase [Bacillus sp. FJAT-22090]
MNWNVLAENVLNGHQLTDQECLDFLQADSKETLAQLDAAYKIRHHFYGNDVKLNMLINTKSGLCPENCRYCSQSSESNAPIEKYRMMTKDEIVEGAKRAAELGAGTFCIVASGRGPSRHELATVKEAAREIKETLPLKLCGCLGILAENQAEELKEAGIDRYNHNINTSEDFHDNIVSTHTFDDRVGTVEKVKQAGISPCSGVIIGMGESLENIISMMRSLHSLDADSVPINFLHAIEGTAFENKTPMTPMWCLRIVAFARFMLPTKEIRIAGGRELNLRSLQPMAMYAANSIFLGDYLTTSGQEAEKDLKMIEDLGFTIEKDAFATSAEHFETSVL